jgi:2-polyprenyl-6-methoxyphenol hydroxylase-like FAD-dependent oxidoreductase
MPRVLISGGSIAGPAAAYWLCRAGFDATVVERAPAPRPGGQAIDIRGRAIAVVERMGLLPCVQELRTRLRGMSILGADGCEVSRTEERTLTAGRLDSGDIEILRDDLSGVLLGAAQSAGTELVFGDQIVGLSQTADGVAVEFARGAPRTFDLVLGADGVRSNVRRLAFGDEAQFLQPLNFALAIFTVPNLLDLEAWQLFYRDEVSACVIYPARAGGELRVNVGFTVESDEPPPADPAALKAMIALRCAHMRGPIPRVLGAMEDATDLYFDSLAQVKMPAWSNGRVALVGDAAYSPSPFTGQGTSLALVGAFVLARELARTPADPAAAFARCEQRMRPYVELNQELLYAGMEQPTEASDALLGRAKNGIALDDILAELD